MKSINSLLAAALLIVAAPVLSAQPVIKFNGSSTTHKMVLHYVPSISAAHGVKIEFVPNGTGRGLEDLVGGRAQVAMITGDLAYFANLINESKPGTVEVAKLRSFQLPDLEKTAAAAIVHPSNPVEKLTHAQLQGLFSGKITNWKEVGGPDLPVIPVVPAPSDGVFGSFTVAIMQGVPFSPNVRRVALATDLPKIVAQLPGAVAFLSVANAVGNVRVAMPEPQFIPPNYLVTIGDPAEPLKSVISELQARVK